jgi:superfamily II DNA/RNA helicase
MVEPRREEEDIPKDDVAQDFYLADTDWEAVIKDKELIKNLRSKGFARPFKIQVDALEYLAPLQGSSTSVIIKSKNGSGKTLAFLLPAIQRAQSHPHSKVAGKFSPQCMIICHNKIVTDQIYEILKWLLPSGMKAAKAVYTVDERPEKNMKKSEQVKEAKAQLARDILPDDSNILLVEYKKTLWEFLEEKLDLGNLNFLAFDEVDFYFNSNSTLGTFQAIDKFFAKRGTGSHGKCCVGLYSATYDKEVAEFRDENIVDSAGKKKYFSYLSGNGAKWSTIDMHEEAKALSNVEIFMIECQDAKTKESVQNAKQKTTGKIIRKLNESGQCVIFSNTREYAKQTSTKIHEEGGNCDYITGSMTKKDADEVLEDFKKRRFPFLFATDIIGRGYDNSAVSSVIMSDLPWIFEKERRKDGNGFIFKRVSLNEDALTHRIGRTGRAGRKGIVIVLVASSHRNDIDSFLRFCKNRDYRCEPIKDSDEGYRDLAVKIKQIFDENEKLYKH